MRHISVISRSPARAQGNVDVTAILAIIQGIITAVVSLLTAKVGTT